MTIEILIDASPPHAAAVATQVYQALQKAGLACTVVRGSCTCQAFREVRDLPQATLADVKGQEVRIEIPE